MKFNRFALWENPCDCLPILIKLVNHPVCINSLLTMKKKKSFKKDSLLTNEDITSCKVCEFLICLDYKEIFGKMSRRGVFVCASLILFQVWITIVAFTSTSLATNPKSEVFPVSHDKFASSIETNTTRNKRLVAQTAVLKGIEIAIKLTDLIARNVIKSFNQTKTKDHKEIIAHFQLIEKELAEQKEELQSIKRDIQMLGLSVGYSQHEKNIKNSLLALHQYLELPDEGNRNNFMDEASQLSKSLTAIVEGLLGRNVFNPDIMAVLRESI